MAAFISIVKYLNDQSSLPPFPGRQQPSILSTGAFDPIGKPLRDLLGIGLVGAGEDHQTKTCARQEKLFEVLFGV